jgi:PPOX class probable F420-dependent enzyme
VTSPLWFVHDGGRLYLTTFVDTAKVKRLRANDRAEVAPADRGGKPLGPTIAARGRFVADRHEAERARTLFERRYGWQFRLLNPLFALVSRRNNGGSKRIYFILDPA